MTFGLVQHAATTNGSGNQASVTINYASAQTAGNLNVVVIGWNDVTSTITSVTDSSSNLYAVAAPAAGQTGGSGPISQAIYYAQNIAAAAAAANTVTVAFNTGAFATDIRILEFSGVATTGAFDTYATGQNADPSITPTGTNELLVGAASTTGYYVSPVPGWTNIDITSPNTDRDDWRTTTTITAYSYATGSGGTADYVAQIAAFVGASAGAPVTPPAPLLLRQAVARAATW